MGERRINPDTGILEENKGLIFDDWQPARNEDGHIERVNPDTREIEEDHSTFGALFGRDWNPKTNDEGRAERLNPDTDVLEEDHSTFGGLFGRDWQEEDNDQHRAERLNPRTGVVEEDHSFFHGALGRDWHPKRGESGRAERINPRTGVQEEDQSIFAGTFGYDWQPTPSASPWPTGRKQRRRPDVTGDSDDQGNVARSSAPGGANGYASVTGAAKDSEAPTSPIHEERRQPQSRTWPVVVGPLVLGSLLAGYLLSGTRPASTDPARIQEHPPESQLPISAASLAPVTPVGQPLAQYSVDHWLPTGPTRAGTLRIYVNALEFTSTDEHYRDARFVFPISDAAVAIKPEPFDNQLELSSVGGRGYPSFRVRGAPAILKRIATDINSAKTGQLREPTAGPTANAPHRDDIATSSANNLDTRTRNWISELLRTQPQRNIRLRSRTNALQGHVFLRYVGSAPFSFRNITLTSNDIVHFEELNGIVYDAKLETINSATERVVSYQAIVDAGFLDESLFVRVELAEGQDEPVVNEKPRRDILQATEDIPAQLTLGFGGPVPSPPQLTYSEGQTWLTNLPDTTARLIASEASELVIGFAGELSGVEATLTWDGQVYRGTVSQTGCLDGTLTLQSVGTVLVGQIAPPSCRGGKARRLGIVLRPMVN